MHWGILIQNVRLIDHLERGAFDEKMFRSAFKFLRADVDKGTYNNPATIIVQNGEFHGDLLAGTKYYCEW